MKKIKNKLRKALASAAALLFALAWLTVSAWGQVTRVEPAQPKWGQTLQIIYDPAARDAKFSLADEVYLRATLSFPDAEENLAVKLNKAGTVFKYELPIKTNLSNVQLQFSRLPDGLDMWARASILIYRPDGEPARGAYLSKSLASSYQDWVDKELALYPDNYLAYLSKWRAASGFDRDRVKEIITADINRLSPQIKGEPVEWLASLSFGYLRLKQEDKSREVIRRMVERYRDSLLTANAIEDYLHEATSQVIQGDGPPEVSKLRRELVTRFPNSQLARRALPALATDKDITPAVLAAIYQQWIAAEPDNPLPYHYLASYQNRQQKYEQAGALAEKALNLIFDGHGAIYNVSNQTSDALLSKMYETKASAALEQGQYAQALAAAKAAEGISAETNYRPYLIEGKIWEKLLLVGRAETAYFEAWRKGGPEAEEKLKAIYQKVVGSLQGFEAYLSKKRNEGATAKRKEAFPPFKFTALDGRQFDLAELRGKVVVLNFWFVACGPCRSEIPDLNKLVAEFKDKNVVFLAPALDKPEELREFLKEIPFNYQIIPHAGDFAMGQMGISAYPTHVIIDQEGRTEATFRGAGPNRPDELRQVIARLLAVK